eukprot:640430-Prymnesium_polylepis.2
MPAALKQLAAVCPAAGCKSRSIGCKCKVPRFKFQRGTGVSRAEPSELIPHHIRAVSRQGKSCDDERF